MIQYADLSSLLGDMGAPIDAPTEIILPPMPESPAGSNVVICSIEDFAPDWGYAYTSTKVILFQCDPVFRRPTYIYILSILLHICM